MAREKKTKTDSQTKTVSAPVQKCLLSTRFRRSWDPVPT